MQNIILVLTGGPAAGKNTVGDVLAKGRERCAVIDVDDVRQMVRQPHHPPWAGLAGSRQQELGVLNSCGLASNFIEQNYDVVILDVVTDATSAMYRKRLDGVAPLLIVHLTVEPREAALRESTRPAYLTTEEFEMLHDQQASFSSADLVLDTTILMPEDIAAQIEAFVFRSN